MADIHPTAVVDRKAEIAADVKIGPYVIIEQGIRVGSGTSILAHSVLKQGVQIGSSCTIGEYAILGGLPQDSRFKGEESYIRIGENVRIREFVTIHRATGEGEATVIGDSSFIMAYVHVSHNCRLGENVTVANAVQLAGHVEVGAQAFIGGSAGIHQFVRIGRLAMVGAHSYLTQDLPPFLLGAGHPFYVTGVNTVGLERAGFSALECSLAKKLYRLTYRDSRPRSQAYAELSREERENPQVQEFHNFISNSSRGIRLKSTQTGQ